MDILSIDFDYFQKVTKAQLKAYPDGLDLDTKSSIWEWKYCYAKDSLDKNKLPHVRINYHELYLFKRILSKQNASIPVMIANSHRCIYNFICSNIIDEPLSLINVDMHHDCINDNPELDCGNWVTHLIDRRKASTKQTYFRWIANPISLDVYGFTDEEIRKDLKNAVVTTLNGIKDKKFDAVFLCRSDMWTPPHLDKHFSKLCSNIMAHFDNVAMERDIDKPRFDFKHISNTEALRDLKNAVAADKFNTYAMAEPPSGLH